MDGAKRGLSLPWAGIGGSSGKGPRGGEGKGGRQVRARQGSAVCQASGPGEVRAEPVGGWAGIGGSSSEWPGEVKAGVADRRPGIGGSPGKRSQGGEGKSGWWMG